MTELLQIAQGIVERGLIFSLVVASVYLSSRLINFDNLSIEGAFGLGGALTALLTSWNVHPLITVLSATTIGALSGVATSLLNTKLKLNTLISGIVITTGLFSIILKIAGSNMILGNKKTLLTLLPSSLLTPHYQPITILLLVTFAVFVTISWLLTTEIGFLLRSVGDSPQMLLNVGKSVDGYIMFGLILSNACAALAGSLFVQYTGYFSIWASVGMLIIGLAGMILAETFSKKFGFHLILGSLAYQIIIALTFELQLGQDWNKLVTALLIVLLIVVKQSVHKK